MSCGTRKGSALLYYPDFTPESCVASGCEDHFALSYRDFFAATLPNSYLCLMPDNATSEDGGTLIPFLNHMDSGLLGSIFMIFGVSRARLRRVFFTQPLSTNKLAFYVGIRKQGDVGSGSLVNSLWASLNPLSEPAWAVFALFACLWLALLRYRRGSKIPEVGFGIFGAMLVAIYNAHLAATVIAPGIPPEPFSSVADLAQKHLNGELTFVHYGNDFAYIQIWQLPTLRPLAAALKSRPARLIHPISRMCAEMRKDARLVTIGDDIITQCVDKLPSSLTSFIFPLRTDRRMRDRADMFIEFARTSFAYHKSRVGQLKRCVAGERSENGPYSTLQVFGPVAILLSLQSLTVLVFAQEKHALHVYSVLRALIQGGVWLFPAWL